MFKSYKTIDLNVTNLAYKIRKNNYVLQCCTCTLTKENFARKIQDVVTIFFWSRECFIVFTKLGLSYNKFNTGRAHNEPITLLLLTDLCLRHDSLIAC